MGKLDGQVAVVTGAAQGIGAATAALLADEGARVAVCDIQDDAGTKLAAAVGGVFYHLDVSDENNWAEVVAAIEADLGGVTILVNNAGISNPGRILDASVADWRRTMAVNVDGSFFGIRAVAPQMIEAGHGVIVNISSTAGLTGTTGLAAYGTSKWAIRGLTKCAALDLADDNIRVLSVHPGAVETPSAPAGPYMAKRVRNRPMPRLADAAEVAKMVLFCVADATFSTGSEFVADGGVSTGTLARSRTRP